jgi:hypothetical protein
MGVVFFLVGLLVASAPTTKGALENGGAMFGFGLFIGLVTRWRRARK